MFFGVVLVIFSVGTRPKVERELIGMVAGAYDKGISEGWVVMLIHSILSILAPKAPHQTHTFHPIHDESEEEGNRQEI